MIELLLAISILIVLGTMLSQGYLQQQRQIEFEIQSEDLKETLFEIRENTRNYKDNSVYGLHLEENRYIWFQGETFFETGAVLTTELPNFITLEEINLNGGGSEIIFEKNSGETNNYGSFKMIDAHGTVILFEINKQGYINLLK